MLLDWDTSAAGYPYIIRPNAGGHRQQHEGLNLTDTHKLAHCLEDSYNELIWVDLKWQRLVVFLNDFCFIIDALWMISSLSEVSVYY